MPTKPATYPYTSYSHEPLTVESELARIYKSYEANETRLGWAYCPFIQGKGHKLIKAELGYFLVCDNGTSGFAKSFTLEDCKLVEADFNETFGSQVTEVSA